ncbi:MAG: rhodanese-like domain-containing protein [Leptolyngbyaceae cyanobacterium]
MTRVSKADPSPLSPWVGQQELYEMSPVDLNKRLDQQSVNLVDVRESVEHAGKKIPGSIPMPLSKFDPDSVPFDADKSTVLYCRTGSRSTQAAQKLFKAGVSNVTHLEGGLLAWEAANYPTQTGKNAPISIFRQVQIVAGSFVVIGTILGALISPWFLLLSGFVGVGLVFAGITDTCALGMLLAQMPWNQ